jgi:LysR family hydrogen peroxide-inducible transcriptional activator
LLPMFIGNFMKKFPKVKLKIEELHTEAILEKLKEGHLDAAIAATPLQIDGIKENVLYYEPFVPYIPKEMDMHTNEKIDIDSLDINKILLLEDGHCFKDGIINLCKANREYDGDQLQLESGSFETLIKLANEGLGMTLLPYLHTLELKESEKKNLKMFNDPVPAREVSLIYNRSELKMQIIEALRSTIASVVKGAITYQNVKIISPLNHKKDFQKN